MSRAGSRRSSAAGIPTGPSASSSGFRAPAAPMMNPPPPREPKPSERIPVLTGTLTAAFISLDEDITRPNIAIANINRVDRLKHILATIDDQRVNIRENILWLLEREKERMVLVAREQEEERNLSRKKTQIPASEVDLVVQSLELPATAGIDYYNIKDLPVLDPMRPMPNTMLPREEVVNRLLNLVETGNRELRGLEGMIDNIRREYEVLLEKELARIVTVGMRPEDRPKAPEDRPKAPEAPM